MTQYFSQKSDHLTIMSANNNRREKINFCSNKVILLNLIIMIILWSVTSLNYYLITYYMKYVPGNISVNTTVSTVSELIAYASSGLAYQMLGGKTAFFLSFLISAVGGSLIAFIPAVGYEIAGFVLLAKFGISFAFNLVYVITPTLFPTDLCSTSFGVCNVFAMLSSVFSPVIAELREPMPMLVYAFTSIVAMIASLFLFTKVKYD